MNVHKKSPLLFIYIFCLPFLFFSLACCTPKKEIIKTVRIGICADVHLPTMHDAEVRLKTFLDSMEIAKPDFIIELGDFGTPAEAYKSGFELWNSYKGEKHHVIGNHEMDGGFSLEEAITYRNMPSSYYSFENSGFNFIVLDGNDKKHPEEKGYRQYIGDKQSSWLQDELKKTTKPVIIFSHQGIGSINGIDNDEAIREILELHNLKAQNNRIIACFNGHSHFDATEEINGIWYITINSMGYKWLGDEYVHIRYSEEIDKNFKWIKYTAPYKDPLYTLVEISTDGNISITGKKSEWVGPSPWELGYSEEFKPYIKPEIIERKLHFNAN